MVTTKVDFNPTTAASTMRERYRKAEHTGFANLLIYGFKGCGKTSLIRTCPKPVLVDMFDPDGEESISDLVDSGDVIVRPWPMNKEGYIEWKKCFAAERPIFPNIGTYCLDSMTTWVPAALGFFLGLDSNTPIEDPRNHKVMEKREWGLFLIEAMYWMRTFRILPCHKLILGHIDKRDDQVTGATHYELRIPGQSRWAVPDLFSNVFVLHCEDPTKEKAQFLCKDGRVRYFRTKPDRLYQCSNRKGTTFAEFEVPDVRSIIKRSSLPSEDKPQL